MIEQNEKKARYLAAVLRHHPEQIGLQIDERGGWAHLPDLIRLSNDNGIPLLRAEVMNIIENDPKRRFTYKDGRVRAAHGHSIKVDLQLMREVQPPRYLYHGANASRMTSIRKEGILPVKRLFVHLTEDPCEAAEVAERRVGEPVVLKVDTSLVTNDLMRSDSGVWLTEWVDYAAVIEPETVH